MRASDPHSNSLKWQDQSPLGPGTAVSAFLHAGMIGLAALIWQDPPAFTRGDVIAVDIVADTPSVVGPETEATTARTGEDTSPALTAEALVSDATPAPLPAPAKQASAPEPPAPPPKQTPQAPPPKTAPSQVTKVPATTPASAKAPAPKTAPTKPIPSLPTTAKTQTQVKATPQPQFDFAAASAAASGAESGGRKTPKLAASGQSAREGSAGGGTVLAGDLESALRGQIYQCWKEPATPSPRLVVILQIELGRDGNLVRDPKLIYPASRAGADGKLLVAVDNAMRAVRQCAPFSLPDDRFRQWRLVNFSFEPRRASQP